MTATVSHANPHIHAELNDTLFPEWPILSIGIHDIIFENDLVSVHQNQRKSARMYDAQLIAMSPHILPHAAIW